jgi:YbbR domain-containing protein
MKEFVVELFTENLSYKLVSLFIALILWVSILNRRDFVLNQNIDVNLKVSTGQVVIAQTADTVKVRVSGPRSALKKFMQSMPSVDIDISDRGVGLIDVDVPIQKIEVPFGLKILGIRPNVIRAEVIAAENK